VCREDNELARKTVDPVCRDDEDTEIARKTVEELRLGVRELAYKFISDQTQLT